MKEIIEVVEYYTGIDRLLIKGKRRTYWTVRARHIYISLLKYHTNLYLTTIGKMVGDRHHSSIINSIQKCQDLYNQDPDFSKLYDQIEGKIK